ncbi:MAG: DNA mismatch repair protein MutS [Bacillota bacterium]
MSKASPMMEQYKSIKARHPDKLLMFQVGDFYELFYEDAELAAKEMEIALTSRDAGSDNPIPLAGVPIHSVESYLNRLLTKGYKVVVCDQVEQSTQAKGLVRREITRILTPGTITDQEMLEESRNNYLAVVISEHKNYYGLAVVDISTGDFKVTENKSDAAWEIIADELRRLQPAEILCSTEELGQYCRNQVTGNKNNLVDTLANIPDHNESKERIAKQWDDNTWHNLALDRYPLAAKCAAAALTYLELLQQLPPDGKHFHELEVYFNYKNMIIDSITSRNLELTQSIRDGSKQGSLLALIDRCMTGMGRRLLRRWVEQPLLVQDKIEARLDALSDLQKKPLQRRDMRKKLQDIFDLERFCSRLSYQRVNARDLVALKNTLHQLEPLKEIAISCDSSLLKDITNKMPSFVSLINRIEKALVDDPPLTLKEGGLFKTGYNEEIDKLKTIADEGNTLLLDFERKERTRTGIKSLRVGYNRNFGYYIEVTKTNLELVPPEYNRKQTLVNAERYTTEELSRMEEQIIGARDKLAALEYELFEELRALVAGFTGNLMTAAYEVACLDCLQGLAETAEVYNYCRPVFSGKGSMNVRQARHPVVEQLAFERFVPNDIIVTRDSYLLVITGPNMAGKSTYIRSAALVAIMAQMGSFVPAEKAEVPIIDRVFARVGASDDLSRGHSTFMVEMQETATILKESTPDSLIILDEIGRGTSTYDGMSIARSVLEYISKHIQAKTLFSTHYHELTNLEGDLPGIRNYTMAVKEKGKKVIFLRQIIPGKADKSYGINVARLAGVPLDVLVRAESILTELELAASNAAEQQLSLLPMVAEPVSNHETEASVIEELQDIDLNRITPMEAMQKLYDLQKQLLETETAEDKE